ncbi:MAG: E3 binding domain-containing protein, partial [Candidatus Dormibacteraeota bacterium]|nr:E3 binding domain-containing protein [Candidatus Dormibacteraeota bacterium]
MASVQMPRLSDSMETGKILRWLKKEGEEVKKGEPLVEIESDKANIEVEAYASGKLSKILVQEGDSAPIGAVIAEIGGASQAQQAAASPTAKPAVPPRPQVSNPEEHVKQAERAAAVPATVAPAAHEEGGGEQYPQGGTDDRTEVGAAAQAALNLIRRPSGGANGERQKVSPVARRIAEEQGVNLDTVRGTGPGGRITKEDVEAAASKKPASQPGGAGPQAAPTVARPVAEVEVVELSKMQTTVAVRLVQSKFSAPHFYVTSEIAMDDAVHLRQMFNEAVDKSEAISVNDLVVKAV